MGEKVFLRQPGDEDNLIEIDAGEVKVIFNGEKQRFRRQEIERIRFTAIKEIPALAAGILMGVLGILAVGVSPPMGILMLASGAVAFYFGMEWQRRLVILLDSRMVYSLTFSYRGVRDIQDALDRHGYLGGGRFPRLGQR